MASAFRRKNRSETSKRRSGSNSHAARRPQHWANRQAIFETLEDRSCPAPLTLVSILKDAGDPLTDGDNLTAGPRQLTFRFNEGEVIDPGTVSGGIQVRRSGFDDTFSDGNEILVTPGFIGIGDQPNDVVLRFAETLPDERYQIQIVGAGANPLRDTANQPFNNGVDVLVSFDLDLGPRIIAVVPQPVTRDIAGDLQQDADQIVVYFNNDPLLDGSGVGGAENPNYYQLIDRLGARSNPASVAYDPATGIATLTFAADLAEGTYQLRIGNNDPLAVAPDLRSLAADAGTNSNSTFADASNLGTLGVGVSEGGIVMTSSIDALPFDLDLPGSNNEPGHRDIPAESHLGGVDGTAGITTYSYTFNTTTAYGADPISGAPLYSQITENQKDRAREIFALYADLAGVQFVEVAAGASFWVITGDPRVLAPAVPTGPGGVGGIAGGGMAIMDAAENWGDSEPYGGWFGTAMHEIGHLLGLGHTYDLPLSNMGGGPGAGFAGEQVLPGDHDVTHLRHLYRPESHDIDLYRFDITTAGLFRAEITAERRATSSLLDSVLTLYKDVGGVRTLIARNDDYFSSDSFIELALQAGTYYIGVTSTGNTEFDPNIPDSGFGGTTQGGYDLRLTLDPTPAASIEDLGGTPLDGDADGVAGGEFLFFFEVGPTLFVDKANDTTAGDDGDGSIGDPFDTIDAALYAAAHRIIAPLDGGMFLADGETFVLNDGLNLPTTFEFEAAGGVTAGNVAVNFSVLDTRDVIADVIYAAINGVVLGGTLFATPVDPGTGYIVEVTGPDIDLRGSPSLMAATNLVRIAGNGGNDDNVDTLSDNDAYEVGYDNFGAVLQDGTEMRVPQGTTVIIDAGAVFKLRNANIEVGSTALGVDRSQAALQILGIYDPDSRFPTLTVSAGAVLVDGQTFTINGRVFELDSNNNFQVTNVRVVFTPADTATTVAASIAAAINGAGLAGVAATASGATVSLVGVYDHDTSTATGLATTGGQGNRVWFTSFRDDTISGDDDGVSVGARPADWGGIVFRNNSDQEANAVFLNTITGADLQYSGGQVVVDSILAVASSIEIQSARPYLAYSTIRNAADAAVSATPDSFEETLAGQFAVAVARNNFDRVGPDIHGLRLVNVSINGLFLRIVTPFASKTERLEVQARFDDVDIVHVLNENLFIAGTPGGPTYTPPTAGGVTALSGFAALDFTDSGGFVPPDTHAVAGGPSHVVEVVNSTVAFFNRSTAVNEFQQSLATFFAPVAPGTFVFDPKVAYDELASRFIIVALDLDRAAETSHMLVAVSDDSNPNGSWERHRIDVEDAGAFDDLWGDYPGLGWDADAIYVTLNMFGFNSGYDHTSVITIDKPSVLDNNNGTITYFDVDLNPSNFTMQPAVMHGAAPGDPMYFVVEAGFANGGTIRVVEMTNKVSATPVFTNYDLAVSTYSLPPDAAQPGGTVVQTNDTRVLNAAWRQDRLVAAQTVGNAGTARARWYEFDTAGLAPALVQSGEITAGFGVHTFFPAIEIAPNGDLGMTFMQSSATEFMSMYVTGRKPNDFTGTMQTPVLAKAGEATYVDGFVRAGDYSGISIDPVDGTFWAANEYATSTAFNNWGTWISNFRVDAATGGPTARLDGRLAIDAGIVLKVDGARIEAEYGAQLLAEGDANNRIVFTSILDDSYGRGGTFDTTNNAANATAAPGDWGGLYFSPTSSGSVDYGIFRYGGLENPIEGRFDPFNVLEIRQAEVRLAHSLIENSGTGLASSDREGRGTNAATTIFVRGAQPVIVDNVVRDNNGSFVSIDANSLQSRLIDDWGRSRSAIDRTEGLTGNHGPLVRLNLLDGNATNGMDVRGGIVTAETVWDDTDIVHVVRNEIRVTNLHTYGGIRLQSSPNSSLVVKLAGATAGFTAFGTPLDIDDRIGGSVHVIGAPGFPVVFTSLADDSIGAGLAPNQTPQFDTNGDGSASSPQAGDWRSIRFDRDSNDRNVAAVVERETAVLSLDTLGAPIDVNGTPGGAQFVGDLAPDETGTDDNRRLGFVIDGFIADNFTGDVDVYSFTATAGSEIWLDIDRTNHALDTIIELVDANGAVLARSVNSYFEQITPADVYSPPTVNANPLQEDVLLHIRVGGSDAVSDLYTTNPRDAGMRVLLPGVTGNTNTYYVRVRSNPLTGLNPTDTAINAQPLNGGLSSGEYQLQVRLSQVDEYAGSTVQFADIRFATNGIEVLGLPQHSSLTGEAAEQAGDTSNEGFGAAQEVGNLLTMDRNTISIGGTLQNADDVDWYSFQIDYDLIQAIGGFNAGGKTWATVFDIDYADGLVRADAILSVFDSDGNLILVARDSDVEDDQPKPGFGQDAEDLSRGTFGRLDPYIGTVQMPEGTNRTYFVAVSSNRQLPQALNMTFSASAANETIKLEPTNGIVRLREDHIGFTGYTSGNSILGTSPVDPVDVAPLIDISSAVTLQTHVRSFDLSDIVLYVSQGTGNRLLTVDPSTGSLETDVGGLGTFLNDFRDIVIRSDGLMYGYQRLNATANVAGQLVRLDPGNAGATTIGGDGIADTVLNTNNMDALAWRRDDVQNYALFYSVRDPGGGQSWLFRADPANGSAAPVTGQPWGLQGLIAGVGMTGVTTGMAFIGATLYGVSDSGEFYTIGFGGTATVLADINVPFAGLTLGPQNLDFNNDGTGGDLANVLFAITTNGDLYAFNTAGVLQMVFDANADGTADSTTISTGVGGVTGLALSPLDVNLWHPTMRRRSNEGHGINPAFDNSRVDPQNFGRNVGSDTDTRNSDEREGAASFYFGIEEWVTNPRTSDAYFQYGVNAQYGFVGENLHRDLTAATTGPGGSTIGDNYNLPGGAHGSLITDAFSLENYTSSDKPTLYFNYYLVTQNANSSTNGMRDSARVFVSADNGLTWSMLATNNSNLNAELPRYLTTSWQTGSGDSRQRIQELFDTTDGSSEWRQARIDLGEFAGLPNLILRFDFSTAGDITDPSLAGLPEQDNLPGDGFGDFTSNTRGQNNAFEGFYIDDLIIGFAERGEMVTGSNNNTAYFTVPQNPNFGAPSENLVGTYQLEIRRGTEYGAPIVDVDPAIIVSPFLDTNDRQVAGFSLTTPAGAGLADGQTFTIDSGLRVRTFEFNSAGGVTGTNIAVNFTAGATEGQMASIIANAINSVYNALDYRITAIAKPAGVNNETIDIVGAVAVDTSLTAVSDSVYNRLGDSTRPRDQGMILIQGNQIFDAAQYGIVVDAGARDANAHPGGARNMLTLNNNRWTYSVLVENNLIAGSQQGGILFSGDPNSVATAGIAPVPFGRIVNNTIYGRTSPTGIGIDVTQNASPTILNNIIANMATAISIDGTSTSTVVGTTVFQNNGALLVRAGIPASPPGSFAIQLAPTDPLFVNPAARNFYLATGSRAIDASLNTLVDRPALVAVTDDVGIDPSPIISPNVDLFGQLRVDDPNSAPPPGLGTNVFIDRGAIERADFTGPSAALANPIDNNAADRDPTLTNVTIFSQLTDFVIQLNDTGVGVDDTSVATSALTVTFNGNPLVDGVDYLYSYNSVDNLIRLTSSAGFYTPGVYAITIDNTTVRDRAGNRLLANRGTGQTAFTITVGVDTLTVVIAANSFAEDAVNPATTATITRIAADNTTPLTVTLTSSDVTEATIQATVIIPANQNSVVVDINSAGDDGLADGTQTVTITASATSYVNGTDTVDVLDITDQLTVVIAAASIPENGGAAATTATITRVNADTSGALVVTLGSSDTTEATVQATATILAGQVSVVVNIAAAGDDGILDGTQTVTITASAAGFVSGSDTVDVTDVTVLPDLIVTLNSSSIAENAGTGATSGTVTRTGSTAGPLTVNLFSSDTTEATVIGSVMIAPGFSSVPFAIDAVDDVLLDGTQLVTITASAINYNNGSAQLSVTDHETLTLNIVATSVSEGAGGAATTATVTRSNIADLTQALLVTLVSSDTTEIVVPGTVTIPIGQASVTFNVSAVEDSIVDDPQTVTVTASAAGYVSGSDTVVVTDNDRPPGMVGSAETNLGSLTFVLDSNNNRTTDGLDATFVFGMVTDTPVIGDWNGDYFHEVGIARANGGGGLFFFLDSNQNRQADAGDAAFNFGLAGDRIVVGDWNGNVTSNLGVARPNGGGGLVFFLDSNGNFTFDAGDAVFNFGLANDRIVIGDWNGDGIFDIGVARPNGGGGLVFFLDSNGNRAFDGGDAIFNFGLATDQIVVGDWNADKISEIGVARPAVGVNRMQYFLDVNGNRAFDGGDAVFQFGRGDGTALSGAWKPAGATPAFAPAASAALSGSSSASTSAARQSVFGTAPTALGLGTAPLGQQPLVVGADDEIDSIAAARVSATTAGSAEATNSDSSDGSNASVRTRQAASRHLVDAVLADTDLDDLLAGLAQP